MFFRKPKPRANFIIFGLGNPGPKYERTRHNCGFMAIDSLREFFPALRATRKWHSEVMELRLDCEKALPVMRAAAEEGKGFFIADGTENIAGLKRVLLVKPQLFMNLSGRAIAATVNANPGVPFVVVLDDVNMEWGRLRLRERGGGGGHKGMKSIIDQIGGRKDFPRLRIGVGGGDLPDVTDYVLKRLSDREYTEARRFCRVAGVKALEIACIGFNAAASSTFGQ
jgi:peptidyl-tRNA hydrolase, PTH1 family